MAIEYGLAEKLRRTVPELRRSMDTSEVPGWIAWGRYKAALEKGAVARAEAEREQVKVSARAARRGGTKGRKR